VRVDFFRCGGLRGILGSTGHHAYATLLAPDEGGTTHAVRSSIPVVIWVPEGPDSTRARRPVGP
jgi:hypothetical protein